MRFANKSSHSQELVIQDDEKVRHSEPLGEESLSNLVRDPSG